MANTFANIVGGIALLILVLWGGFSIYDYVKSSDKSVDEVKPIEPTNVKPKRKPKTK
jgi:hypothetical protein